MKLKEVIPFVDLKQTIVYVPDSLIEQMPSLNKLVNNSGEYYSRAYNYRTKKLDFVIMSLSEKTRISHYETPFKIFKYVSSKKDLFEFEIQSIESTIINYDTNMLRIVLRDKK